VLLPVAALLLIALPALLLSWAGEAHVALGETVPPPATETPATEVPPQATPTPRATQMPTLVPTLRPTSAPQSPLPTPRATPSAPDDSRVRVAGVVLQRVIGDRRSSTVYGLTTAGALFRSNNNGFDWRRTAPSPEVIDFILSPDSPSTLYSSAPLVCAEGQTAPVVKRSDDGGASWITLEGAPELEPLWVDGATSDRVLAAGCDGLYASDDGGVTWQPLSTAAQSRIWRAARAVEIEEADGVLYALLRSEQGAGFVAVSSDGGGAWLVVSPLTLEEPFAAGAIALDPASMGRMWAAGAQGVWVTEDQGQFWGLSAAGLEDALPRLNDIVYHPRDLLFVASDAGFYGKAADERAWEKLGVETTDLRIESLLLTESAPRRLWLNTEIGVYRFLVR
jgi:hypothetical protein